MNKYSLCLLSLSLLGLFSCKIAKLKEQSSRSLQEESTLSQQLRQEFLRWQSERADSLRFTEGLIWFPGKVRMGSGNSLEADSAWMQLHSLSQVSTNSEGGSFALRDSLGHQQAFVQMEQDRQVKEKERTGFGNWIWMVLTGLALIVFWRLKDSSRSRL